MLDLINKLLSGLKEKLVSAWNWVKGLFSSKEDEVKKPVKEAEVVENIRDHVSEEDEANAKAANELALEIISFENKEMTKEQLEDFISKIEKLKESSTGFAKVVLSSHKVRFITMMALRANSGNYSTAEFKAIRAKRHNVLNDIITDGVYITEALFVEEIFADEPKCGNRWVDGILDKVTIIKEAK